MDLNEYMQFVAGVTSKESNQLVAFNARLIELHNRPANAPLLLTAAMGLGSESGEFQEIVKKIFFQGKPLDGDNIYHMKRELGDILWYWVNACRALDFNPQSVINENVAKLRARYTDGFSAEKSENRKQGDI